VVLLLLCVRIAFLRRALFHLSVANIFAELSLPDPAGDAILPPAPRYPQRPKAAELAN